MTVTQVVHKPTLPDGVPDDWALDRDLHCPRCGYNLRMLRLPRCPECGAVYRWQRLLAVVCPRCGDDLADVDEADCPCCALPLDWATLFTQADATYLQNYEHSTTPIRAAVMTWIRALRPRHFWTRIKLEHTPVVPRLNRLRRAGAALCIVGLLLPFLLRLTGPGGSALDLFVFLWAMAFVLPITTALALPYFTPTLARFRIRRDQLLRCCAYASAGWAWFGVLLATASALVVLVNRFWWGPGLWRTPHLYFEVGVFSRIVHTHAWWWWWGSAKVFNLVLATALVALCLLWWWRFLYAGLRHYLRLDRPSAWALLISTQIIGLILLLFTILVFPALRILLNN